MGMWAITDDKAHRVGKRLRLPMKAQLDQSQVTTAIGRSVR